MKTKSFWGVACALLVFLLVAPNAFGQDLNSRLTIFGGGSFLKGERAFVVVGDQFRSDFANGGKFGFRGTVDVDSHWAVEGTYSYGTNNLRIFELRVPPRERAFGTRVHQFAANALYFLNKPEDKMRAFVTGGLGLTRYSPTDAAKTFAATFEFVDEAAVISSDTKLSLNFGAGVEAKVHDRFGVRFDFRDNMTRIPRFGVPETPPGPAVDFFPVSGVVHDWEASIGVVIYLR